MNRNARSRQQQHRKGIERRVRSTEAVEFFNILTDEALLETVEALSPVHRERLYPPTVTLSMFMQQTLDADGSCQKVVNGWAVQRAACGLKRCSTRTGGYCRARSRLPLSMIKGLARETGRHLHEQAHPPWCWQGRPVKLVDGSGISMPDTVENQARYPQPGSQAAGVGFPLGCLVVVICLATGAILDAAMGAHRGKGSGELGLFRGLDAAFEPGDVMLADALYCNYFLIATLARAGVDVLFEQHGSRITDFRRGKRFGARDHLVAWPKPARPAWMTPEQYRTFADELRVRETQTDHQVLVTTLTDHRKVRKADLADLYARRWHVELDLRNIKTTMGMEVLHCRTPDMNEKELWVHLLAYNLIRLLMAQAAGHAGVDPRSLSFKHTLQLWAHWHGRGLAPDIELFCLIAQSRVGHRPGRIEPRQRKRRPKSYPWLKKPRDLARDDIIRYGRPQRPK
ncbi:IS4 family transposase [Pollutimonas subterranea]|uniref:IS4 family transposase n=1 Tax=Pollutimonas subterranea TaxID=2045210 RepID=A0A2N4TYL0_9BURK|nr:IS4 family transposase [Pollutimonas subterranea]PLC47863.1 IS4 family transposase [Pollutimonas subterranea]